MLLLRPRARVTSKPSLILDQLSAPVLAGYTTRRVIAGQPDPIVANNGSTELTIGFSGNDLDHAALEAHATGNGFVASKVEVGGSGNNAVQATAANQPQIVSGGAMLVTANGKPRIKYDGVNDFLSIDPVGVALGGNDKPFSLAAVMSVVTTPRVCFFSVRKDSDVTYHFVDRLNTGSTWRIWRYDDTTAFKTTSAAASSGFLQLTYKFDGALSNLWENGVQIVTNFNTDLGVASFNNGTLGRLSTTSIYFKDDIDEILIFSSAISDADRILVEDDQTAYWGTP